MNPEDGTGSVGPTAEQAQQVILSVDALTDEVRGLRDDNTELKRNLRTATETGEKNENRTKWLGRSIGFVLLLLVLVGWGMWNNHQDARHNHREAQAISAARAHDEADRLQRSVGSCKQQNATFIHDHNELARKDKANWNGIASLISSMSSHPDDPQTKAFIASLRAVADSYDENIIPLRTCTAAGIEKYNRELLGPG